MLGQYDDKLWFYATIYLKNFISINHIDYSCVFFTWHIDESNLYALNNYVR